MVLESSNNNYKSIVENAVINDYKESSFLLSAKTSGTTDAGYRGNPKKMIALMSSLFFVVLISIGSFQYRQQNNKTASSLPSLDEILEVNTLSSSAPGVDLALEGSKKFDAILKARAEIYFKDQGIDPNVPPRNDDLVHFDLSSSDILTPVSGLADSNFHPVDVTFTSIGPYTYLEARLTHQGQRWLYATHLIGASLPSIGIEVSGLMKFPLGISALLNADSRFWTLKIGGLQRFMWDNGSQNCQGCSPYKQYAYAWPVSGGIALDVGGAQSPVFRSWSKEACWSKGTTCAICAVGCCKYNGGIFNWTCD